jgi:hypothetical protein
MSLCVHEHMLGTKEREINMKKGEGTQIYKRFHRHTQLY